ncbi:MAG: DUF1109 domain-containing protein [Alphaproteobacteria bacterium]|nr:MAG: DUF1109 domain-containing protein [Alphaproteobacteria bacterium]
MTRDRDSIIAAMTEELTPVRGFRYGDGVILVSFALFLSVLGVAYVNGLWSGIVKVEAAPFFWITNGLLLLLGLASASAAIAAASPYVGNRHDAPRWATAMVGVLPLAALISLLPDGHGMAIVEDPVGIHCFTHALATSSFTGAALILWLRRGAPVSLNLAGWHAGLAAGALGAVAYGLSCPLNAVTHLGVWHVLPVALAAVIGRLAVPRLVSW